MLNNLFLPFFYFAFLVSATSIGSMVSKHLLRLNPYNTIERFIYNFALGCIFYSLIFVYLGALGVLSGELLLIAFFTPCLVAGLSLKKILPPIFEFALIHFKDIRLILLLTLPLIAFLFIYPTSWDALAYHLSLPKMYINQNLLTFYPWFPESAYVIGIQSLFGYAEALGEIRLSNFITFGFFTLSLLYILFGLRDLFDQRTLGVAVLLFLLTPFTYSEVAVTPYVDYPFAFFVLVATASLAKAVKKNNSSYLMFALLVSIFASFIKYTGLIFLSSSFILILLHVLLNKQRSKLLRNLFSGRGIIAALFVFLPVIYWYLRNFLNTKNPVYPYFNNVFKGLFFDPADYVSITDSIKTLNPITNQNLPSLVLDGITSSDLDIFASFYYAFFLCLTLIFCVLAFNRSNRWMRYFLISCFAFIVFTSVQVGFGALRYFIPILPIASVIVAWAFLNFLPKAAKLKINLFKDIIAFLILCQFVFFLNKSTQFLKFNFPIAFGSTISEDKAVEKLFLQDNYYAIDFLNSDKEILGEKILIMFDNRTYYYDMDFVYGHPDVFFGKGRGYEKTLSELKVSRPNYIVESSNWGYPNKFDLKTYNTFKKNNAVLYKDFNNIKIYRINTSYER